MNENVTLKREVFDDMCKLILHVPASSKRSSWEDFFTDVLVMALKQDRDLLEDFLNVIFNEELPDIDFDDEIKIYNRHRGYDFIDIVIDCGETKIGVENKICNHLQENQLRNYLENNELDYIAYIRKDSLNDNRNKKLKKEICDNETKYLCPGTRRKHFFWKDFKDIIEQKAEDEENPLSNFLWEIFKMYGFRNTQTACLSPSKFQSKIRNYVRKHFSEY